MFIIDRLEGDWAVVESSAGVFNLPRALLPEGAKEGDVLKLDIALDLAATAARRRRIKTLLDEILPTD
ncbi:MAG: DUF3006 domain-containing protein [Bacillota bacterium]